MKKIDQKVALSEQIYALEFQQRNELRHLKSQFHITYESLKPVNFIKSTIHDLTSSPDLKNNLLNNAIGFATGYISKKVLLGGSHNPIKNILGIIFEFVIASVVSKKASTLNKENQSD